VSGIGKGIVAASTALLMKSRSHSVEYIKFDPYLSIDAGCLSPNEHGETFVLDDSKECDLDLGHVERLSSLNLTKDNICTSGTLFKELIEEQERGDYLGQTINNSFIVNKIIDRFEKLGSRSEIVIAEIGGTVDESESTVFLEAVSRMKQKYRNNCLVVLVAPVLWMDTIKEFKTKPLQRGVRDVQSFGIIPDILVCRSGKEIPKNILEKISNSTGIHGDNILIGLDTPVIYSVPIQLYEQNYDDIIADKLGLKRNHCKIQKYKDIVEKYTQAEDFDTINIGIVSKYENRDEAYLSIKEALTHAAMSCNVKVQIHWIKADELEKYKDMRGINKHFENINGIIIAPGFDSRGIEGKIKAIQYAREKKVPLLGICLGLQLAVVEFARNVCDMENANSMEFNKDTPYPVIHYMEGQEDIKKKQGTMRLGSYDCELKKDSLAFQVYGTKLIKERHRHRLEVNQQYLERYANNGFNVSGINPDTGLVEMMELDIKLHPYFLLTQAHPEYKSRLVNAAPLFKGLIVAAIDNNKIMVKNEKL
jgi:CTP synthase